MLKVCSSDFSMDKKDWKSYKLHELCDIRIGRTPRRDQPRFWGGKNIWVSIRDLGKKSLISDSREYISDIAVSEVMGDPIPVGTLLFSFKLTIGKTAVTTVPLYTNEAIAAFVIKDDQIVDRDYLRYTLNSKSHEGGAETAVLGKLLNKEKLRNIIIEVPPLNIQKDIVRILFCVDSIKEKRNATNHLLSSFAPALFRKMFGDIETRRFPLKRLDEVVIVKGGGTPSKQNEKFWNGSIPWVSPKDMGSEAIEDTEDHITETAISESTTNLIPQNSLLVVTRSGILKHTIPIGINVKPMAINQDIKALIPSEEMNTSFLFWQLRSFEQDLLKLVKTGATVQSLNTDSLMSLKIIVPPILEQLEFAKRIEEFTKIKIKQSLRGRLIDEAFSALIAELL